MPLPWPFTLLPRHAAAEPQTSKVLNFEICLPYNNKEPHGSPSQQAGDTKCTAHPFFHPPFYGLPVKYNILPLLLSVKSQKLQRHSAYCTAPAASSITLHLGPTRPLTVNNPHFVASSHCSNCTKVRRPIGTFLPNSSELLVKGPSYLIIIFRSNGACGSSPTAEYHFLKQLSS